MKDRWEKLGLRIVRGDLGDADHAGKKGSVWLYGVFDKERCIYVGQTTNIQRRLLDHRGTFGHGIELKQLRRVGQNRAIRIEGQIIHAYWRRGQAEHNRIARCPDGGNCRHSPYYPRPRKTRQTLGRELAAA